MQFLQCGCTPDTIPPDGLAGEATSVAWFDVTPEQVVRFLASGPTSRKTDTAVSDITRRRYWRLLERIYGFALARGWVAINPAAELAKARDLPPVEDPQGAIVTPAVWNEALTVIERMDDDSFVLARNRALLLVLFHLGLTPQELRLLATTDVLTDEAQGGGVVALQLDGTGPNQQRRLQVPPVVGKALAHWLRVRFGYSRVHSHTILFCSTHNQTMSADNLLLLVKAVLKEAAQRAQQPLPPRLGPQIVRNSRLVKWLNEDDVPAPQVVIWAGLKDMKGLNHLKAHLKREVRSGLVQGQDEDVFQPQLPLQPPLE